MMSHDATCRDDLVTAIHAGASARYVFFWSHQPRRPDAVDEACLSQWWPCSFTFQGHNFPTAEHAMMWAKASLFGDARTAEKILTANSPGHAKSLGRQVVGFDEATWSAERESLVTNIQLAKFAQNPPLITYLQATRRRVLAEASPKDPVWGIGLTANDPDAMDPTAWPGLNLLGFALMRARNELCP